MKQIYSTSTPKKAHALHQAGILKNLVLFIVGMTLAFFAVAQKGKADTTVAPELVFMNPVLVSGTANSQGAIYRFSNVTSGVDAEITLKKFSRPDIVMTNVDLPSLGWEKAFQPQFGLQGYIQPNQNWYIDFECTFYEAGNSKKQRMDKFDLTSLDVDGDGVTIAEYVQMERAKSVSYSTLTSLVTGIPEPSMECGECGKTSVLVNCGNCDGKGRSGSAECGNCKGSGKIHDDCDHAWDGSTNQLIQGTVLNFANIDTAATQVMATYSYANTDKINFRIGATTGSRASNGAGIRLNSLWFRSFSLAPQFALLPVKEIDFSVTYINNQVNLKWTSAQENQFMYFVVEKSVDGKNFKEIKTVYSNDALGNYPEYKLTEVVGENSAIIYYRIKMVDTDQKTSYSSIRVVRLSQQKESVTLLTYPNPTVNEIRVTVPATWQGNALSLTVYNQSGQIVKQVNKVSASQTETVVLNDLETGIYIIKAATATDQVSKQFIKTK